MSVPRPGFRPPAPVGAPFRGDPRDAMPFPAEGSAPAAAVLVPATSPAVAASSALAPAVAVRPIFRRQKNAAAETPARRSARAALAIGLLSLLVLPVALGPLAIVLGVRAIRRGERRLGAWAVAAGAAGTVLGIVGMILWATGVLPNLDELLKVG